MDDLIRVDWISDKTVGGYEITIPFYKWWISVYVVDSDDSCACEDIRIMDKDGRDVTDDYMIFKGDKPLRTTGKNLYQVMDLLRTNLKGGKDD